MRELAKLKWRKSYNIFNGWTRIMKYKSSSHFKAFLSRLRWKKRYFTVSSLYKTIDKGKCSLAFNPTSHHRCHQYLSDQTNYFAQWGGHKVLFGVLVWAGICWGEDALVIKEMANDDILCGIGYFRPKFLQKFANRTCYLIIHCLLASTQVLVSSLV